MLSADCGHHYSFSVSNSASTASSHLSYTHSSFSLRQREHEGTCASHFCFRRLHPTHEAPYLDGLNDGSTSLAAFVDVEPCRTRMGGDSPFECDGLGPGGIIFATNV